MIETSKNIVNDSMKSYSMNRKRRERDFSLLCETPMFFLGGTLLQDVSCANESCKTRSKIRKIIEKRVCSRNNALEMVTKGNGIRYRERQLVSSKIERVCGPYAYTLIQ